MANPSPDKGNEESALRTVERRLPNMWDDATHEWGKAFGGPGVHEIYAQKILSAVRDELSRTTPPSPSTAPEVDDPTKRTGRQFMDQWNAGAKEVAERQAFEGHERGSNLRRVGEGQYENPCVQSAWEGCQARSALASRPAEVDDEGLPPLPESAKLTIYELQREPYFTAEQFRQGQRDAVAADRARRGDGWIDVKDHLPEIGREVLVYRPKSERSKVTALARFIRYEGASDFYWDNSYPGKGNMHLDTSITHWMPIPAAPCHATNEDAG